MATLLWKVLALVTGLVAARTTKALLDTGWRRSVGDATNGGAKAWEKTTGRLPPGIESVGA